MTLILASRSNVYSSGLLDRLAHRCEDPDWINDRLRDPNTLLVPVWRSRGPMRGTADGKPNLHINTARDLSRCVHLL